MDTSSTLSQEHSQSNEDNINLSILEKMNGDILTLLHNKLYLPDMLVIRRVNKNLHRNIDRHLAIVFSITSKIPSIIKHILDNNSCSTTYTLCCQKTSYATYLCLLCKNHFCNTSYANQCINKRDSTIIMRTCTANGKGKNNNYN